MALLAGLWSHKCNRFAHDTRIHVLNILFRLTLDRSLIMDAIISSDLERTITTTLEGTPEESVETTVRLLLILREF